MGTIKNAIGRTLRGAVLSYQRYPAAMLAATALAVLTSIRIADNSIMAAVQFDRWQIIFALTALISLALSGWLYNRKKPGKSELLSLGGLLVIIPLFILIRPVDDRITALTGIRSIAAGAIAVIALLIVISRNSIKTDFSKRFFMLHKAFFIALLYMLVVMGGLNFTAAAVEILLYSDMSSDVYQYLSTWSGFLGFAFFLGNLPDLKRSAPFDIVHNSQKKPRFIEVLFVFVMIPIVLAISTVLLLWALRMLITRSWPDFAQLASIFSGYILLGSWLTIMVADAEHGLANFFRRVYPILAILFLIVEGVAIFRQIESVGIRGGEYVAALIWVFGMLSALFFLIRQVRHNHLTAWTAAILILVAVMPLTGYSDFTLRSQLSRVNRVLEQNNMLTDDNISPASADSLPSPEDQILITESVSYLASLDRYDELPAWFPKEDRVYSDFKKTFGFEQRWNFTDIEESKQRSVWVRAESSAVDISNYDLMLSDSMDKSGVNVSFETDKGSYRLFILNDDSERTRAPVLRLEHNGSEVINYDFEAELDKLGDKARTNNAYELIVEPEELQFTVSQGDIRIMIVVSTLDVNWEQDVPRYYLNIGAVYFSDSNDS